MASSPTIDTPTAPVSGVWNIDPGHADVAFVGRHFGLTRIRGRFVDVSGTITIAEPLDRSSVEVTIGMASVSSGDTARDDHLRSDDFFDVEHHPTATFRSTQLTVDERAAGGPATGALTGALTGTLTGDLTITGVTRPVELHVQHLGNVTDPWGGERMVFTATGAIDREDWGLTWNMVLDAGGLLVSKQIQLEIEVELVRPQP